MSARPQLHLVDSATGELVEDDRDTLIAQQAADIQGKNLTIGKLKKQLSELRLVEPESQTILDILEYWRTLCSPTAVLAPGGKRWEKTRARLMEKLIGRDPFTPKELKLAIDGALLDPWINGTARGSTGYLDPQTIFRDSEIVERLRDLALGFQAKAGIHLRDLLDVADELRVVNWKFLLRVCLCGHRRVEHARGDANLDKEPCFECDCDWYVENIYDDFDE